MRLPLVFAACLACACGDPAKNAVELTVGAAALDVAKRDAVRTLTIDVAGAVTASKSYSVTGLRPEERLELIPSISSGELTITVTAIDDRTNVVGRGDTTALLTGSRVRAGVTLMPVGPPAITVTPTRAKITRTRSQKFTADKPVVWTVSAGGGTVDTDGLYTAPDLPGAATLTATLATDDTVSVSVPLEIADYGIELLAGPTDGPGWADGIGGTARFSSPSDIAVTSDGTTLYVAERDACLVRKVDVATSTVTTLAGRFGECKSTDATASDARFNTPQAIALDESAGLLYIADLTGVRTLRLADATVSTVVAVGGGVGGLIKHPTNNHLYLTRIPRHVVVSIDLASPALTVIAGTNNAAGSSDGTGTSASFRNPRGLATDGTSLFIADGGNYTIRQMDLSSQAVTTVAGAAGTKGYVNGDATMSRLLGPTAMTYADGAVRFSDCDLARLFSAPCVVRTFVVANKSVSLLAGAITVAAATDPYRPAPSADGSLMTATFADVFGVTVLAGANSLYLTERVMGTVRRLPLGGGLTSTVAGTSAKYGSTDGVGSLARFWQPASMTRLGPIVYLSDNTNNLIRSLDLSTGDVKTVAGAAGVRDAVDGPVATARFKRPEALTSIGRVLYLTDSDDPTLRAIDLDTGTVSLLAGQHGAVGLTDGVGTNARFTYPVYLVNDGKRYLYMTESATVRRVDIQTGEVTTIAGTAGMEGYLDAVGSAARFAGTYGMTYDGGTLYVCDFNNHRIRTVNPQTFEVRTFLGGNESARTDGAGDVVRFAGPAVCSGDGRGLLYVFDAGAIRRVDLATRTVTTLVGRPDVERTLRLGPLPGALNDVGGILIEDSGDLIVSEYRASSLIRLRIPRP